MSATLRPLSPIPAWYASFQPYLMAMACNLGYSKEDASDLLHQLFLELMEKKVNLLGVQNPRAFLATAFRRKLIDHYRSSRSKWMVATAQLPDDYAEPSVQDTQELAQYNAELVLHIKKALSKVPERCRRVIYLKFYEGLGHEEIARITGLSKRSVYNNLFEGIKILRSEMTRSSPGVDSMTWLPLLALLAIY